MMSKRWRAAVLGLVSVAAMLSAGLVGASPASASTGDTAVAGGPPTFNDSDGCAETASSIACFQTSGDKIWVYDFSADGLAAAGYWSNYLRDSAGNWVGYRTGECVNHLGAGHWGYCNYDFYEDTTHNPYDGYGSGVNVYPLTEPGEVDPGTYAWVRNIG